MKSLVSCFGLVMVKVREERESDQAEVGSLRKNSATQLRASATKLGGI